MTYDQTRDSEQLSYLDDAIGDFISRYNSKFQTTNRRTVIFFPGAMGSHLLQASTAEPYGPPYFYSTLWVDGLIALGAATNLQMQGDVDYLQQIVVADGPLDLLIFRPYQGFIDWCDDNNIDYFIFGWDWRRDPGKAADFFLNIFMPRFEQLVGACNPHPLLHLSLVGHSFGGMVVKLILNRSSNPYVQLFHSGVTVASPFYGHGGQLARYFIGEPDLYAFYSKRDLVRIVSSLAGGYTLMFLDNVTYGLYGDALKNNDQYFPLANYPVLDATTRAIADPYVPATSGGKVRYPQNYGFNPGNLARGKVVCQNVAAPLAPSINDKFFNIRGVQTDNNGVVDGTVNNQTWEWIAPDFNPDNRSSPIVDYLGPGDGTLPAWSTRLISAPAGNIITLSGNDIDHMWMMGHPQVTNALDTVI